MEAVCATRDRNNYGVRGMLLDEFTNSCVARKWFGFRNGLPFESSSIVQDLRLATRRLDSY